MVVLTTLSKLLPASARMAPRFFITCTTGGPSVSTRMCQQTIEMRQHNRVQQGLELLSRQCISRRFAVNCASSLITMHQLIQAAQPPTQPPKEPPTCSVCSSTDSPANSLVPGTRGWGQSRGKVGPGECTGT